MYLRVSIYIFSNLKSSDVVSGKCRSEHTLAKTSTVLTSPTPTSTKNHEGGGGRSLCTTVPFTRVTAHDLVQAPGLDVVYIAPRNCEDCMTRHRELEKIYLFYA